MAGFVFYVEGWGDGARAGWAIVAALVALPLMMRMARLDRVMKAHGGKGIVERLPG